MEQRETCCSDNSLLGCVIWKPQKANSPYVEYPLANLGAIIKALEDLKNRAIQNGYYSDAKILKCEYPEDTIITDKNCKDTVLPSMNTTV